MTDDREVVIVSDDGTEHVFPAGFDPVKAAAIVKGQSTDASVAPMASHAPTGAGASITGKLVPAMRAGAEELATNPNVPARFAQAGRFAGAVGAPIAGAVEGGPVGALAGLAAAAKSSWAGGKTGWFSGKLAQSAAAPIAKALAKVEPVVKAIAASPVVAAQAGLDLAQQAEPNRTDIGFMGMGKSPSAEQENQMLVDAVKKVMKTIKNGTPAQAAAIIANGDMKVFGRTMIAYAQDQKASQ